MKKNLITVISSQGENNEVRLHINYENNVYYKGTPATDWSPAPEDADSAILDNLSVGGTNLVQNSGNPKNTDGWSTNGSHAILMATKHPYWKNNQENLFLLINKSTNGSEATFGSGRIKVERNTNYTLSYWAFEDSYVPNSDTYFLGRKNGETSDFTIIKRLVRERVYSGGHAEYVSVTFNTGDIDEGYIRFDNNGNSGGNQSGLYIANIKLEKGNVATDWPPAPDDDIYVNFHEYPAVNVMNESELNNQVSELNANGFRSVSKSDYQRLMN